MKRTSSQLEITLVIVSVLKQQVKSFFEQVIAFASSQHPSLTGTIQRSKTTCGGRFVQIRIIVENGTQQTITEVKQLIINMNCAVLNNAEQLPKPRTAARKNFVEIPAKIIPTETRTYVTEEENESVSDDDASDYDEFPITAEDNFHMQVHKYEFVHYDLHISQLQENVSTLKQQLMYGSNKTETNQSKKQLLVQEQAQIINQLKSSLKISYTSPSVQKQKSTMKAYRLTMYTSSAAVFCNDFTEFARSETNCNYSFSSIFPSTVSLPYPVYGHIQLCMNYSEKGNVSLVNLVIFNCTRHIDGILKTIFNCNCVGIESEVEFNHADCPTIQLTTTFVQLAPLMYQNCYTSATRATRRQILNMNVLRLELKLQKQQLEYLQVEAEALSMKRELRSAKKQNKGEVARELQLRLIKAKYMQASLLDTVLSTQNELKLYLESIVD